MPHNPLIEKLQTVSQDVYLVQWITDYLTDHTQYVVVNVVSSKPRSFLVSVLWPLLFLIYSCIIVFRMNA